MAIDMHARKSSPLDNVLSLDGIVNHYATVVDKFLNRISRSLVFAVDMMLAIKWRVENLRSGRVCSRSSKEADDAH
jgi:hypothetical protein